MSQFSPFFALQELSIITTRYLVDMLQDVKHFHAPFESQYFVWFPWRPKKIMAYVIFPQVLPEKVEQILLHSPLWRPICFHSSCWMTNVFHTPPFEGQFVFTPPFEWQTFFTLLPWKAKSFHTPPFEGQTFFTLLPLKGKHFHTPPFEEQTSVMATIWTSNCFAVPPILTHPTFIIVDSSLISAFFPLFWIICMDILHVIVYWQVLEKKICDQKKTILPVLI